MSRRSSHSQWRSGRAEYVEHAELLLRRQAEAIERRDLAEQEENRIARERLQNGSYGVCLDCDERIPLDALQKLPYARHCRACRPISEPGSAPLAMRTFLMP